MGKVTNTDMDAAEWNNYRARCDGEETEFHAKSVRQAWYMAYDFFESEALDYLAQIDQNGIEANILLDKED
jgi:hypothetical protein